MSKQLIHIALADLEHVVGGFEHGSNDHIAYLDDFCQHFDFKANTAKNSDDKFFYKSQADSMCGSARDLRAKRGDVDPYARAGARELLK